MHKTFHGNFMAMKTHCRISSVRYKKAPHVVEIIPRPRQSINPEGNMRKCFEKICDIFEKRGMAGMTIVAWDFDGTWNRATEMHRNSFVGQTLLPAFVSDILRRDTMKDVVHDTIIWAD